MNRFKRTAIKVAAITTGVLLAGGIASAYWSVSGGGEGTMSTTESVKPLTVTQSTVVEGLYPGAGPVLLLGTVSNPNAIPVQVNALTAVLSVDKKHAVDCDTENYWLSHNPGSSDVDPIRFRNTHGQGEYASYDTVNANISASATAEWRTWVGMRNTDKNQDGCLGAVITLTYTIS